MKKLRSRLVELYAKRNEDIGFAFSKDDDLQREFEEAFEYEATPDQMKAYRRNQTRNGKAKTNGSLIMWRCRVR